MKITDYPSVSSLADGDVILIDGNNGTKKLPSGGDISKMTSNFTSSDIDENVTGIITSAGGETAMPAMTGGDTHGGLFELISKSVRNTRKLINTVKRLWQTVANAWVSGASYSVGQVVTYTNGHTYICKLAHTSSASIKPGNTTYWEDKTIGDMIYSLNTNITRKKEVWNTTVSSGLFELDALNKVVHFKVNAFGNGVDNGASFYTLPTAFRPTLQSQSMIIGVQSNGLHQCYINIYPTGEVSFSSADYNAKILSAYATGMYRVD